MRARVFGVALAAGLALAAPVSAEAVSDKVDIVPARMVGAELPLAAAEKNDTIKIESPALAGSVTLAAASVEVPAAKPSPPPVRLRASINLSSQTMTVSVGDTTKYVWKISSGRGGYHTPTGTYRPQWMTRMHYSKKYDNAPMPHSVFFHRGYAIHATYATGALGRPASHGCIRLSPANAKTFYQLVSKYGKASTRIAITGSTPSRAYAKRKTSERKSTAAYSGPAGWQPAPKKTRKSRKPAYVKKKAPAYSYYAAPKRYTWPGDR